jgi:hypothetical protein
MAEFLVVLLHSYKEIPGQCIQTMITGTFHALAHSPFMIIPYLDAIILEHEGMQLNEQAHANVMGTKFPRINERILTYLINIS